MSERSKRLGAKEALFREVNERVLRSWRHELLEIERIVEEHPNYLVVEKQDPAAEEVALD